MNKTKIPNIFLLIIPICFYLFFALYDGPIWCVDTLDYLVFNANREPLYPLLSNLFKILFSENYYLQAIVIFQSILVALSTYILTQYIIDEFQLDCKYGFLIEIIFICVSLLCRFASKRGAIYSNCLLTEGITYPVFILFFRYVLDYSLHPSKNNLILSILLSFIMLITRKQMIFCLFLLLIAVFVNVYRKRKLAASLLFVLVIFVLVFGCTKLFDVIYMKTIYSIDGVHTGDNRFITTMIFYTADKEDADYIEDKEVKDLFINIYEVCDKNSYLQSTEISGWYNRVRHFSDNYDHIQIDTMVPIFSQHAKTNTNENANVLVDKYNSVIINSLLIKKLPDIMLIVFDSFLAGLMITISADRPYFAMYSIVMYCIYIVLLISSIKKYKRNKFSILGLLTLLSIILNVGIISMVIFNQTRYTFYNMALFYISLILMLYNVIVNKRKDN